MRACCLTSPSPRRSLPFQHERAEQGALRSLGSCLLGMGNNGRFFLIAAERGGIFGRLLLRSFGRNRGVVAVVVTGGTPDSRCGGRVAVRVQALSRARFPARTPTRQHQDFPRVVLGR